MGRATTPAALVARALGVALACCLAAVVAFTSAQAAPPTSNRAHTKHLMKGRAGTTSTSAGPMVYGGGPIVATPRVYLVFWGPEWQTGFTTGVYSSATAQTYPQACFAAPS